MNVSIVDEGEKDDTPQKTDKQTKPKKNKKSVTSESANIGGIYNRIIHFFRRIFFCFITYQERIRE
jgi:hypothetical protein